MLIIVCAAGFFAFQWYQTDKGYNSLSAKYSENKKIDTFISLFVNNMLGVAKDISFDQRLQMENSVRSINNTQIFNKWEAFTTSSNSAAAQINAQALLQMLTNNLK
jgi:hypothetical protein